MNNSNIIIEKGKMVIKPLPNPKEIEKQNKPKIEKPIFDIDKKPI